MTAAFYNSAGWQRKNWPSDDCGVNLKISVIRGRQGYCGK